jgi:hypothetical protein
MMAEESATANITKNQTNMKKTKYDIHLLLRVRAATLFVLLPWMPTMLVTTIRATAISSKMKETRPSEPRVFHM